MKKLQDFWNANGQNKFIILALLFLIMICILSICIIIGISGSIVFGASASTPTSCQPTKVFTAILMIS
ncbi:MAG: hypothetical protein GY755_18320 [Chloroflexi bacterium]|nr:hypothetical protein [Chloroflexota bacterium]